MKSICHCAPIDYSSSQLLKSTIFTDQCNKAFTHAFSIASKDLKLMLSLITLIFNSPTTVNLTLQAFCYQYNTWDCAVPNVTLQYCYKNK